MMRGSMFCLSLLACGSAAMAQSVTVTPSYIGSFDKIDGTNLGVMNLSTAAARNTNNLHQFALRFSVDGLASDQDFRNMTFSVSLGAGLHAANFGSDGFNPYVPNGLNLVTFAPNNPPTWKLASPAQTAIWTNNEDLSTQDLINLFVNTTAASAYRVTPGEAGDNGVASYPNGDPGTPTFIGTALVGFDNGYTGASSVAAVGIIGAEFSYWTNNATGTATQSTSVDNAFTGQSFAIGAIPEPASLGLLGLAGLAALRRRR